MLYFRTNLWRLLATFFLLIYTPMTVMAMPLHPIDVPSSVDPGQVENYLNTPVRTMPQLLPATRIQSIPKQPTLPAKAKQIKFHLKQVILDGNTVFSEADLKPLYQDKLNKQINLYDLQQIAQAITVKYRNKGYILSRAVLPPQHIDSQSATATIQIIEGFVDRVYIKGKITTTNKYSTTQDILRSYGQRIAKQRPLNMQTLERFALLSNDIPGLSVRTVLRPSTVTPGAADLILYVEQSRAQGSVTLNNRGTRYLGPIQGFVNGSVNSVLFGGDTTGVRGVKTPLNSSMNYIEFFHEQAWGSNGLVFHISYDKTETNPRFKLESFDMTGDLSTFTTSLNFPIIRSRPLNWYIHGRAHYINSQTKIASSVLYDDRLRTITLGTTFNAADHLKGYNAVTFDWVHGFPIWGASKKDALELSRPNGRSNFDKMMITLSRIQNIDYRWSMLFSLDGQAAFDSLLSPEQISIGGGFYGQAYDPSEVSADNGIKSRAELRFDFLHTPLLRQNQLYVAYDYGTVFYHNRLSTDSVRQTLSSYGTGLRLNFKEHVALTLEAARPVARGVNTLKLANHNAKRWRYFFNLRATSA